MRIPEARLFIKIAILINLIQQNLFANDVDIADKETRLYISGSRDGNYWI